MAASAAAAWSSGFVGRASNSGEVITNPSSRSGLKVKVGGVLDSRRGGWSRRDKRGLPIVTNPARRKMNGAVRASAALPQVELDSRRGEVSEAITQSLDNCLTETYLDETVKGLGPKIRGKVSFPCFLFLELCLQKSNDQ